MKTSRFDTVSLQVTGEPLSEVYLVDGSMRRIASGVGSLSKDVAPGVYKIRTRKGSQQLDRLIEVTGNDYEQYETAPTIPLTSAAPIYGSSTSHEYQAEPAHKISLRVHTHAGSGSRLFVYIRDPKIESLQNWDFPPSSLSIHGLDGNPISDLDSGETDRHAGFSALNIELNPGTWRLRVETGALGAYEIFVTTVLGWQTQVFLVMDEFPHSDKTTRRPSLKDAVVMMSRIEQGFNPHGEDERLVSLARTALAFNRPLMSGETMSRLVDGKFSDPLFGIYALGLLLLEKKPHGHDTAEILNNLGGLLGSDHPDLLALKLAFNSETVESHAPFDRPPLLYQSWQQMLRFSRNNNRLIPGDSLLGQLAEDFVVVRPWLIHRLPAKLSSEGGQGSAVSIASAKRTLATFFHHTGDFSQLEFTNMPALSGLEAQIIRKIDDQTELNRLTYNISSPDDDEVQANRIFSRLKAPGYSIANAVERIATRLNLPMS